MTKTDEEKLELLKGLLKDWRSSGVISSEAAMFVVGRIVDPPEVDEAAKARAYRKAEELGLLQYSICLGTWPPSD